MNRYLYYFGMVPVWYGFRGGTYTRPAGGVRGPRRSHPIPEPDITDVHSRMFLCFWGLYTRGKSKVVGFKCAMTEEKHEWVVSTGWFGEKCRQQNNGGINGDPWRSHCRHEGVWSPCEHKRQCHQQRNLPMKKQGLFYIDLTKKVLLKFNNHATSSKQIIRYWDIR